MILYFLTIFCIVLVLMVASLHHQRMEQKKLIDGLGALLSAHVTVTTAGLSKIEKRIDVAHSLIQSVGRSTL